MKLDQKQLASGEGSTALAASQPASKPRKRRDLRQWRCPMDVADGCQKAAVEATLEVMESTSDPKAAIRAGNDAFKFNMPKLTSRQNVRAYIACVDVRSRGGWIDADELVAMVRLATASIQSFSRRVVGREVPQ